MAVRHKKVNLHTCTIQGIQCMRDDISVARALYSVCILVSRSTLTWSPLLGKGEA